MLQKLTLTQRNKHQKERQREVLERKKFVSQLLKCDLNGISIYKASKTDDRGITFQVHIRACLLLLCEKQTELTLAKIMI
jgi:hypothetical protein